METPLVDKTGIVIRVEVWCMECTVILWTQQCCTSYYWHVNRAHPPVTSSHCCVSVEMQRFAKAIYFQISLSILMPEPCLHQGNKTDIFIFRGTEFSCKMLILVRMIEKKKCPFSPPMLVWVHNSCPPRGTTPENFLRECQRVAHSSCTWLTYYLKSSSYYLKLYWNESGYSQSPRRKWHESMRVKKNTFSLKWSHWIIIRFLEISGIRLFKWSCKLHNAICFIR